MSQAPVNITLILYHGIGIPTTTNTTNYYEYRYRSLAADKWTDPEYAMYVNDTLCKVDGTNITFGIGLDQNTTFDHWKLAVLDDTGASINEGYQKNIWIERPKTGLSMSGGDFILSAEPFTAGNLSSYPNGGHALVSNMGNVPLRMPVTFSSWADRITVVNLTQKLSPSESANLHLIFQADSWSPRKLSISGTVRGEAMYTIPSGTVSLTSNYETTLNLRVKIGRSDYELGDMGNVRIQYMKSASIEHNETIELDVYLSGTTTVDFKLTANMMTIKGITQDNVSVGSSITDLALGEDSEYHFHIVADPKKTNTKGFINYEISGFQVEPVVFSTEISIGPKPPGYHEEEVVSKTVALVFMLLTVALIGGFMGYYHFIGRKRLPREHKPEPQQEGEKKPTRLSRRGKKEGDK